MRKKRPRIARLDQVRISRDGEDAIIEFSDPAITTTHLRIGPRLQQMSDEDILIVFNRTIAAGMNVFYIGAFLIGLGSLVFFVQIAHLGLLLRAFGDVTIFFLFLLGLQFVQPTSGSQCCVSAWRGTHRCINLNLD